MPRTTIQPKLMMLYTEDGEPMPALALGATSAEAVKALDEIRAAPLTPKGRDPKLVAPVAFKTRRQNVKRADGSVIAFSVTGGISTILKDGDEPADVL